MRVLLVLLAVVGLLAGCSKAPPPYESRYTPPTTATEPTTPPFDVASINQALQTPQPYAIAVLGDSTGNSINEWVHLWGQRIAATYGRQVTIHDWENNGYGKDTVYGAGAPVTIWNASGPGQPAQWSASNYQAMVPEPADLTIINHGHNSPRDAVSGIGALVEIAHRKSGGGVVVLTQNPRADTPERAELEANTYRQINQTFNNPEHGTVVVDVFSAFPTGDALLPLLDRDRVHPSEAGSRLWADTVWAGLGLR